MPKFKALLKLLLCLNLSVAATITYGITEQQAQTAIRQIYQELRPGQGPNSSQRQRIQSQLQQWHDSLEAHSLQQSNLSYQRFTNALRGWHRWTQAVSRLQFSEAFPKAHSLPDNLIRLLPSLTQQLYTQCTNDHQLQSLHHMMSLLKLMTTYQLDKQIGKLKIDEKIESCGQFELQFYSQQVWLGHSVWNMVATAKVPFKIQFDGKKNLGKGVLLYQHFSVTKPNRDCNIDVLGKENGALTVSNFSFNNNQLDITLILSPLWERWNMTGDCRIDKLIRANNHLSTWHYFHRDKMKDPSNTTKGYVMPLKKGSGSLIGHKQYKRSARAQPNNILSKEHTTIKVIHTPSQLEPAP